MARRAPRALVCASLLVSMLPWLGASPAAESATDVGRFIVMFREQPDPTAFAGISDLAERRQAIVDDAVARAERVQAGALAYLQQEEQLGRAEEVHSMWIVNAIAFKGQTAVADALAARPEVESVSVDELLVVPDHQRVTNLDRGWQLVQTRVRDADPATRDAWSEGFSGAGVVVASIDTGVEVAHPALEAKYRGFLGPNNYDNNYNWFDFVEDRRQPADPHGHGTHVMGTIVGGDGPGPGGPDTDTGSAFAARWMGARAFDANGVGLTSTVLRAAAFILAPTNVEGLRLRPDLAPDVVNNSWGTIRGCRLWWSIVMLMWRTANIMPVFSIGDDGKQGIATAHSPGDLREAMGVGATDQNDARLDFSGQGPGPCNLPDPKPDIVAPGIGIWSSTKCADGVCYIQRSGTSMAAPQVSGAAALMIEAAGGPGSLTVALNHIDAALEASADKPVTQTACDNAIGCGRLDVLGAIDRIRADGVLVGTVSNAAGVPVAGARVGVVGGPGAIARTAVTDATGAYRILSLKAGSYSATVRAWSYVRQTVTVLIVDKQTTRQVFTLDLALLRTVQGRVLRFGSGDPVAGVSVRLTDAPSSFPSAVTNADGEYFFASVPEEEHTLAVTGDRCSRDKTVAVVVDAEPNVFDVVLDFIRDGFGYFCQLEPIHFIPGTTLLPLAGDDLTTPVTLPFDFPFYNSRRPVAHVSTNGFLRFDRGSAEFFNTSIPRQSEPNAAIYGFWDDLAMDARSKILVGAPTDDSFVIEWRDMTFFPMFTIRVTFSITLHRNGDIEFQYLLADEDPARGESATIGIENDLGVTGFQYSHNQGAVRSGLSVLFSPARQPGWLRGVVTESDGPTLPGAKVRAVSSSGTPRTTFANSGGTYRLTLNAAPYTVEASNFHYLTGTEMVTLSFGVLTTQPFPLKRLQDFSVSGTAVDENGVLIPDLPVTLNTAGIPDTRTDQNGEFLFTEVPTGSYQLGYAGSGLCRRKVSLDVQVAGNIGVVLQVPRIGEITVGTAVPHGYRCKDDLTLGPVDRLSALPIAGLTGDDAAASVDLPFTFPYYGVGRTKAFVSTNGFVRFDGASAESANGTIPSSSSPNLALYALWDDLIVDAAAQVLTRSGSDFFAIEWRNVGFFQRQTTRISFEIVLRPSGDFEFNYISADPNTLASGSSATIGIENSNGTVAFLYSANTAVVRSTLSIAFTVGKGDLVGSVRAADNNALLPAAKLLITDGAKTVLAQTNAFGGYGASLPAGTYSVTAYKFGFVRQTAAGVVVSASRPTRLDFLLARAPVYTVTGTVIDQAGLPVPNVNIDVVDTFLPVARVAALRTDSVGRYSVNLPAETYDFRLTGTGRCQSNSPFRLTVDGNLNRDIDVTVNRDAYGYACLERSLPFLEGGVPIPLPADGLVVPVPLPFEFTVYGDAARVAFVSADGSVRFNRGLLEPTEGATFDVFKGVKPDAASDLLVTKPVSQAGIDVMVITWRNMLVQRQFADGSIGVTGQRIAFTLVLRPDGTFSYHLRPPAKPLPAGTLAHIGIQDACGTSTLTYYDTSPSAAPTIFPGHTLDFTLRFSQEGYTPCP